MEIKLSNSESVAIIDDEDYPLIADWKWRAFMRGYAAATIPGEQRSIFMHHLIVGYPPPGLEVDHIDGNGLNNQRQNLRFATKVENGRNQTKRRGVSRFLGVTWQSRLQKWRADISVDGKTRYIGVFEREEDAAKARDKVAKELFGDFANLNFKEKEAKEK